MGLVQDSDFCVSREEGVGIGIGEKWRNAIRKIEMLTQ